MPCSVVATGDSTIRQQSRPKSLSSESFHSSGGRQTGHTRTCNVSGASALGEKQAGKGREKTQARDKVQMDLES